MKNSKKAIIITENIIYRVTVQIPENLQLPEMASISFVIGCPTNNFKLSDWRFP